MSKWLDRKFLTYLLIGGTAALLEWSLFYVFNKVWAINYLFAVVMSFVLSTLYHYILTTMYVFESGAKYNKAAEISLVFVVSVMGLLLNLGMMYLLVDFTSMDAMLSKIIASALVTMWNYLARKKWIF